VERHVDLWTKRSSVHSVHREDERGPRPRMGTRASGRAALLQGASSSVRGVGGWRVLSQRQRIDMISPATMAPKPMAKFHADSETMNGMRSPAT
jgi:hypothetical protein